MWPLANVPAQSPSSPLSTHAFRQRIFLRLVTGGASSRWPGGRQKLEGVSEEMHGASAAAAAHLRLTISGSAAMPVPVMQAWETLTGAHPTSLPSLPEKSPCR
eukprot:1586631-Pyramimonas_sp.AAC.2